MLYGLCQCLLKRINNPRDWAKLMKQLMGQRRFTEPGWARGLNLSLTVRVKDLT